MAATSKPDSGDPCASQEGRECAVARRVFTIHHVMMRVGDRLASEIGLTSSRWMLLCAIGRAGDEDATVGSLSEQAMLSPQNISRMLAAMEEEELVERSTKPGRGRAVFVRLTDKGYAALDATRELTERFERWFLCGINEERRAKLCSELDKLIENLESFQTALERGETSPVKAAAG